MRSIKDFTDVELDKQIEDARIDLDQSEYGTGDYNHARAELAVAEREKKRRGGINNGRQAENIGPAATRITGHEEFSRPN